jgi:arylsulfatase
MNTKLFSVLLLLLMPLAVFAETESAKPNIIIVMPDDAGYGDYACLGNPVMRTPSVDAFKKQSLLFTRFHVSPTCAPCRGALMSGRHEFGNGITHTIGGRERLALSTFTLPQMLKSAGYATGIFGKWHLGDEEAYRPESRGFDEVYIHGSGGIGQSGDAPGNSNHDPTLWHNGQFVRTKGYCTDLFFQQAIRWMEQRHEADQPFFAYVSLNAPHAPHVLPKEYYQHYLGKPDVQAERAKFFGMIENIDSNFGKLLTRLNEWHIADNTLVVYLGTDNGGTAGRNFYNAGLRGGKAMPYQGGTRAPCFVRWPAGGVPAGVECDALTSHVDLFPTIAQLAGATLAAAVEQQLEGRSLVPLLKNPKARWAPRILVHHVGRWPKGQASDFKYTKYSIQNADFALVNNEELYDLKSDPGETTNVLARHPEVVTELRAAYEKWWSEVQPCFVNEDTTDFNHFSFRELYEKQFGKAATAEAVRRSKELRANRDRKKTSRSDTTDPEQLQKLREDRRKRREGKTQSE